jgi:hypothetical protein
VAAMKGSRSLFTLIIFGALAGLAGVAGMGGVATSLRRLTLPKEKIEGKKLHPEFVVEALAAKAEIDELDDLTRRQAAETIHYGYGAFWGAVAAVVTSDRDIAPLAGGAALAAPLWAVGFGALLPALGAHQPFWKWGPREYMMTGIAHLTYGTVTMATIKLLRDS